MKLGEKVFIIPKEGKRLRKESGQPLHEDGEFVTITPYYVRLYEDGDIEVGEKEPPEEAEPKEQREHIKKMKKDRDRKNKLKQEDEASEEDESFDEADKTSTPDSEER